MRRKTVGNKVVSVLLAGALAASLTACGGNTANTGQMQEITQQMLARRKKRTVQRAKQQQILRKALMQQWLTVVMRQRI